MCEFIKIINIGGNKSFIYDANINRVAELPEYISNKDFRFTREFLDTNMILYKKLIEEGFFRGEALAEISNPLIRNSQYVIDNNVERLNLKVTNSCNLACRYCFFSEKYNHKKDEIFMQWEVAQKSIAYYIEHSGRRNALSFHFYGGEPLLNFKLIKKCVNYTKNQVKEELVVQDKIWQCVKRLKVREEVCYNLLVKAIQ